MSDDDEAEAAAADEDGGSAGDVEMSDDGSDAGSSVEGAEGSASRDEVAPLPPSPVRVVYGASCSRLLRCL